MIEVHHMIVDILLGDHQVADQVGGFGDFNPQGIFHRADGSKGVHRGANTAGALGKRPGFARVATAQNDLDPAHHRAGRIGLCDGVACIQCSFNAQMAFDAGNRVNNNSLCHIISCYWLRSQVSASSSVSK